MKRSQKIKLSLMVPVGMLLTACGSDAPPPAPEVKLDNAKAYKSVEDCINGGIYTETACTMAYEEAMANTPKFQGKSAKAMCEEEYGTGNCETRTDSDGNDWFMPAMMGYMVGNMMSGNSYSGYNNRVIYEPIYRDRKNNGDFSIAAGNTIKARSVRTEALSQKLKASHKATYSSKSSGKSSFFSGSSSTKRSGFGSSSSFRGSFGG
jgi:uncharacterized protein YgiB involved in biofilm formation